MSLVPLVGSHPGLPGPRTVLTLTYFMLIIPWRVDVVLSMMRALKP